MLVHKGDVESVCHLSTTLQLWRTPLNTVGVPITLVLCVQLRPDFVHIQYQGR